MGFFSIGLFILILVYVVFICWCLSGWKKLKSFPSRSKSCITMVSIIVPARNEEKNISDCLLHLSNQDYFPGSYEIIVVNDHSTDNTGAMIENFRLKNPAHKIVLLNNDEEQNGLAYKKQAITKAIQISTGELIVTTDADCEMSENWLASIVSYYESEHPDMISAPVCFHQDKNIFEKLQSLEFMGLIGIGAGAVSNHQPMMCNGANLAYTKKIFNEVNGFAGSQGVASGDDTQLMLKIAELNPSKIHFLKSPDAIVYTQPASSANDLLQQRKRWASKIPSKMNSFVLLMGCVAYTIHVGLLILLVCSVFDVSLIPFFLLFFTLKIIPEFIFLHSLSGFFRNRNLLKLFFPAQFIYMIYILFIGASAPFSSYHWKERTFKPAVKYHN